MIKFYCDSCGNEIKDLNEKGDFEIQEKTFGFIKHQKEDQLMVKKYIFCIDCARKIREYFQKLNQGNGNAK